MTADVSAALILLVEDFADAREMYHGYLTFSGFRVETAGDGHEAVEKAKALLPDLILMDLSLPGMNGWEATRILKADPATQHITIVALSAHALSVAEIRNGGAACDGFIAKPCLPPDLVAQITGFLKLHTNSSGPDGTMDRFQ
jgi:two-component system, cell cycle response regulator DivK